MLVAAADDTVAAAAAAAADGVNADAAEMDAKREEELENLLGVVDGMDLDACKRVRRPTVLDLKSAVEAAEQQNAKRLKSGMLDSRDGSPELQHTHSQTTPLPRHYYDEPDPAK